MAAADYFQPTGPGLAPPRPPLPMSQQPSASYLNASSPPHRASSHPNVSSASPPPQQWQGQQYSQGPPPPPYEPINDSQQQHKPSVHFAPTPQSFQEYHRPNSSGGPRPNPQGWAPAPFQQAQKPQAYPSQQHQQYTAQSYHPQVQQNLQPYTNNCSQPPHTNGASHLRPNHLSASTADLTQGYSSDPEPHRRRRRKHHSSGHNHRDHSHSRSRDRSDQKRRKSDTSRSANADGFLGAAGGGLIGDLIFPGLGTVGGALAGWIGGRGYGERRKSKEDRRDRTQYEWEERWGRPHSGEKKGGVQFGRDGGLLS